MSNQLSATGQILKIGQVKQVSDKFRTRELIIKTDTESQYPQTVAFQLSQDRVDKIEGYQVGDTVTVHFNLRGREWTNTQGEVKYFNTLDVWRIERTSGEQAKQPVTAQQVQPGSHGLPFYPACGLFASP